MMHGNSRSVALVKAAVTQKKLGRCRATRRQAKAAMSEKACCQSKDSDRTAYRRDWVDALERYVDRNVGEPVDGVVSEFVQWNGHEAQQDDCAHAASKSRD